MNTTLPIASANISELHSDFTDRIMPAVEKLAKQRFARNHDRDEKVQSATCLAWKAYRELRIQNKQDRIFPSIIADFACRHARDGREVGGNLNCRDVLSPRCQRRNGFSVTGFGNVHELPPELHEALGQHDRSPVPDQVAFRVDFPRWLRTIPSKARKTARMLMMGHGTGKVSRMVGISPGRVSQLRRELLESWCQFLGEPTPAL